ADGAQSSRVPIPLPDDPYVVVGQAQLVDPYTESDLKEAPSEAEESQPLGSRVPLMSEEFEASEPSGTRAISSHSLVSSDSTDRTYGHAYLDGPILRHVSPNSRGNCFVPIFLLEGDELGDKDTEEDKSLDSNDKREGQGLDDEGQGLEDKGPSIEEEEEEEATPEGQEQEFLVVDTTVSKPLGLGYEVARRHTLESTEEITPSTYEVGQSSSFTIIPVVPSHIASSVATPAATISDHTQCLDALSLTLFEDYDWDLRELYTRSWSVRDEIFSQRYRFMSLEREQERNTETSSSV
nr:hypothetical protein [Tanacetum cinerariifolium]